MSETKKPTDDKATTTNEELSEDQLEQVTGGALDACIKVVVNEKPVAAYEWITPTTVRTQS